MYAHKQKIKREERKIKMNKVILMGRLTMEPEVKYTAEDNPTAVAKYQLAVKRNYAREGQPNSDFIRCVTFGRNAEFTEKYLHRGTKIVITGRIQTGNYTNQAGQKVYTTDIIVEEQEFAESKAVNEERANAAASGMEADNEGFMNIPDGIDEDLPFN